MAPVSWLPFFEWCEQTALATTIQGSLWLFPVIEAVHLLGLAVLGGSMLLVNLRLLGVGLRRTPVSQVAADAGPWFAGSLAVMVSTGIPLFMTEAVKCFYNGAFWFKMIALALAVLFTFGVQRRMMRVDRSAAPSVRFRLVGGLSLLLWFSVAAAGRAIGFY